VTDERPNPDIFWTDEEVEELKAKGIISTDPPICVRCGKPFTDCNEECPGNQDIPF
jgi:hypothetical protein